jgi:hypothetical protein
MNADRLFHLVLQRKAVLEKLLEISHRQVEAIEQERMNELMSLLAEKQNPLAQLREHSKSLAEATLNDPETRVWDQPEKREQCQNEHAKCEEMLQLLMEIEAECEQSLSLSRKSIQQKLEQTQTAQQAAVGYSLADQPSTTGGQLDLSSQ